MENSAAEGKIAEVNDSTRPPVRRRLVQSTLFADRFPIIPVKEENGEGKAVEDEDDADHDEEESRGRAGKGKRKRKARAQPKDDTKDPVMCNAAPNQRTQNRRSSVTLVMQKIEQSLNYAVAISPSPGKRSPQQSKKQLNTTPSKRPRQPRKKPRQVSITPSTSPQSSKKKANKDNTTPRKGPKSGGLKRANRSHSVKKKKLDAEECKDIRNEDTPQPVTDLWLEAKIRAKENARLSAGKQTHPFFSMWKACQKVQDTMETSTVDTKNEAKNEDESTCGPIHVFEVLQEEPMFLDWRNWVFHDGTSTHSTIAREDSCSSVFEGFVHPLKFANFCTMSNPNETSLIQTEVLLDQSHSQVKMLTAMSPTTFSLPSNTEASNTEAAQNYLEMVHERDGVGFSGSTGCTYNADLRSQDRIKSYYHGCANLPVGSLWTNKYEPGKTSEVCGNEESIRFLNEWLGSWNERYLKKSKKSADYVECSSQNSEDVWYQIDSDAENTDEGQSLKNVLLVTGPVGSGKSSAIYACGREQGFEVIEVSASDWRNGTVLKEKFGEAVESQRFKWTRRNPPRLWKKPAPAVLANRETSETANGIHNEVVELISSTDEEVSADTQEGSGKVVKENGIACREGAKKSLILFEDVDIIFREDRGFVAAIQQFARTARCPIILTSNCKDPLLPDNLDRLEVSFTVPSLEEIVSHIYMVCAAEKVKIQPKLIERIVECCRGDIRKIIMLLQFWCQGGQYQDRNMHSLYGPMQFDIEAAQLSLPKVIPWGFPSHLSDLVEKEITKSLSMVQGNANTKDTQDAMEMHNTETETIVAKKESMLSRNCSIHEGDQFSTRLDAVYDLPDVSGSPVVSTRKSTKRRMHTVVSSDSEDEFSCGIPPDKLEILSGYPSNDLLSVMSVPSICLDVGTEDSTLAADPQHCTEREKSEGNHYKYFETETDQHIGERGKWVDISCVPESSFVPETEISDAVPFVSRTPSFNHLAITEETVSVSCDESMQRISLMEVDYIKKTMPGFQNLSENRFGNTFYVDADPVNGDDEVGDSQNDHSEHPEAVTRGYQVMDECSRINFHKFSPIEDPRCTVEAFSVQETWQKLRQRRTDLKSYVTPQQRDAYQMVKLTSQMTCLISDTDLMLSCCQLLISDSLEGSMVRCVELDSYHWYDDQIEMASTTAQHGLCFYEKECAAKALNLGPRKRVDLAWEMLTSTANTTAMGKLITQDMSASQTSCGRHCLDIELPRRISTDSSFLPRLYGRIQSMVPPKSHFALMGAAFHEYMFTLGQISRSETSRLSETFEKTERSLRYSQRHRGQAAQHYLNSGALVLSEEDLVLLSQLGQYSKVT